MKRHIAFLFAAILFITASAQNTDTQGIRGWSHFAWGTEVGGAIDLTSHDLSSVNLGAYFGYRNSWLQFIGIGAEVNMMVNNSVRSFPVYAMLRTSFSKKPKLLFLNLRGGVVFNNITASQQQAGAYLSPGVGFNLASGRTFQAYVTLNYVYNGIRPFTLKDRVTDIHSLSMADIRLGICF